MQFVKQQLISLYIADNLGPLCCLGTTAIKPGATHQKTAPTFEKEEYMRLYCIRYTLLADKKIDNQ